MIWKTILVESHAYLCSLTFRNYPATAPPPVCLPAWLHACPHNVNMPEMDFMNENCNHARWPPVFGGFFFFCHSILFVSFAVVVLLCDCDLRRLQCNTAVATVFTSLSSSSSSSATSQPDYIRNEFGCGFSESRFLRSNFPKQILSYCDTATAGAGAIVAVGWRCLR